MILFINEAFINNFVLYFQITEDEYANAQYPITNMKSLTVPDYDTDLLMCSGHFNKLHVYSDGKVTAIITCPSVCFQIDIAKAVSRCVW